MPSRQDRFDGRRRAGYGASSQRTAFGYWVPLALTVTAATIGLAAWIWSERNDGDDDEPDYRYQTDPPSGPYPSGSTAPPSYAPDTRPGETTFGAGPDYPQGEDESSVMARMSGALRRTPSPQQIFDGASRKVAAGVAAAGALVGGALSSIREEDRRDFEDHSRWSEEADSRSRSGVRESEAVSDSNTAQRPSANRKTVIIVVSSVSEDDHHYDTVGEEHASILAHLPEHVDTDRTRVFVLIYAPELQQQSKSTPSTKPPGSVASSFSNIAHEDARESPEPEMAPVEPKPVDEITPSPLYKTLTNQAKALVEKQTMIMPFTTPSGHVHIIRHLSPDTVYIQESLTGLDGDAVKHITGWVREVVVVVGDEGGRGDLIDSEDEIAIADSKEPKWWQKEGITGIGKRIFIVDGHRTGDDWRRRVTGRN